MLVFALSVRAATCPQVRLVVQAREVIGMNVRFENDAPSVASIATIRSPVRDEFFAAETAATVASVAGLRINANMIDEFHFAAAMM
jgi:hypothetical protein